MKKSKKFFIMLSLVFTVFIFVFGKKIFAQNSWEKQDEINSIFRAIMGRQATDQEKQNTQPTRQIINDVRQSEEYQEKIRKYVKDTYRELLGREVDQGGLDFWADRYPLELHEGLKNSEEYQIFYANQKYYKLDEKLKNEDSSMIYNLKKLYFDNEIPEEDDFSEKKYIKLELEITNKKGFESKINMHYFEMKMSNGISAIKVNRDCNWGVERDFGEKIQTTDFRKTIASDTTTLVCLEYYVPKNANSLVFEINEPIFSKNLIESNIGKYRITEQEFEKLNDAKTDSSKLDLNQDGEINCSDLKIIKLLRGSKTIDLNKDGKITTDDLDLFYEYADKNDKAHGDINNNNVVDINDRDFIQINIDNLSPDVDTSGYINITDIQIMENYLDEIGKSC